MCIHMVATKIFEKNWVASMEWILTGSELSSLNFNSIG